MQKSMNTKQMETIVDASITALGFHGVDKTDPQLLKEVFEEFKLGSFNTQNKTMQQFLDSCLEESQDLKPMKDSISKNIVSNHPAIVEFLEHALEKEWLQPSNKATKSLNVAFVLEALTSAMCNDHDFFIEIQDHYKRQEKSRGINSLHTIRSFMYVLGVTRNFFDTLKGLSVDPVMIYLRTQRGFSKSHLRKNRAKQLLKDKKINYLEYRLLSPIKKKGLEHMNELVRINIYEAGVAEYRNGFKANSISAHVLNEQIKENPPLALFKEKSVLPHNIDTPFYNAVTQKQNLFPTIGLSQDWVSLYTSWNIAFVISEIDDWDIVLPKLFIPSIIGAEPENFMLSRAMSLWLTINHVYFRMYEKKSIQAPANRKEMAAAWGEINKKYAFDLAKTEIHEDSEVLMKSYKRFFSHPFINWIKIARKL